MVERWRAGGTTVKNGTALERMVSGNYVLVGYLDPLAAPEVVDILNAVPVHNLQKQVAVMCDDVQDILRRVTALAKERR